eukprot:TRINITY_DN13012_c0_g1_i1.p1 TRINITY_DN13012_c0_g1~~TRINITY_DN13012_c0_g1_i1.p1  ORF type:complete len:416 (-),score=87.49 TRINITY_DN13012_c0_g1_i1:71-1270(-)
MDGRTHGLVALICYFCAAATLGLVSPAAAAFVSEARYRLPAPAHAVTSPSQGRDRWRQRGRGRDALQPADDLRGVVADAGASAAEDGGSSSAGGGGGETAAEVTVTDGNLSASASRREGDAGLRDRSTLAWARRLARKAQKAFRHAVAAVVDASEAASTEVSHVPYNFILFFHPERCYVLSDSFGYAMQGMLFTACLGSLFLKWANERPRREPRVFLLDCSKQLLGALWYHALNMLLAEVLSRVAKGGEADECAWYLVNFVVDCSCGLMLNVSLLKLTERSMGYSSGNYLKSNDVTGVGDQDVVDWQEWLKQLSLYCGVVTLSKSMMVPIMLMSLDHWAHLGALWTTWIVDVDLRLFFVMVIAPAVLDILFFWVTDEFIKSPGLARPEPTAAPGKEVTL